jgi:preprotein translocase subunit SecA
MTGLYHFSTRDASGHRRYDRDALVSWASQRFGVQLDHKDIKNKLREEVHELLLSASRSNQRRANELLQEAAGKLDQFWHDASHHRPVSGAASSNGAVENIRNWLRENVGLDMPADEIDHLGPDDLSARVFQAVEDRYRPEIRRMERQLLLELLDSAWKDHLLSMDHLRDSIGLVGYAQKDPKVEYKREGMRMFDEMWKSLGEQVTDLVFRMERLDESFVGSTWAQATARHDEAVSTSDIARQQQDAIDNTRSEQKPEPIRNRGARVGRNDPCPCGSGRKFKNCCMREGRGAA